MEHVLIARPHTKKRKMERCIALAAVGLNGACMRDDVGE
jgi:hypothetical protein